MRPYAALFLILLASCGRAEKQNAPSSAPYFDVQAYFNQEVKKLSTKNPVVHKTVVINGSTENKALKIADWNKELSSFIDADINKRAWEGEFKVQKTNHGLLYTSNNDKVPVKKLEIRKDKNGITSVTIILKNSNYLYSSADTLSYYPDSLYQIKKIQQIQLMSAKSYRISGAF